MAIATPFVWYCILRKYTDLCSGHDAFGKRTIEQVNLKLPDGFENEPLINAE